MNPVRIPGDRWKRRLAIAAIELFEPLVYRELLPPFSMRRFVGEARWDIGGEDFRATGKHFVAKLRDAGLNPASRVLDIGSGCGRIALPLTSILGDHGSYAGMEISEPLVRWCAAHITKKFPQFKFVHSDIRNPHYNPRGREEAAAYQFPFADASFDLLVATSVFTHLLPEVAVHYLRECARVLQPGGRLFATFYFVNARSGSHGSVTGLHFRHAWGEHARVADTADPEGAIAYDVDWILQQAADAGLRLQPPVRYGNWTGRTEAYSGQDVLILRRQS